jgi:hypothetical protein
MPNYINITLYIYFVSSVSDTIIIIDITHFKVDTLLDTDAFFVYQSYPP